MGYGFFDHYTEDRELGENLIFLLALLEDLMRQKRVTVNKQERKKLSENAIRQAKKQFCDLLFSLPEEKRLETVKSLIKKYTSEYKTVLASNASYYYKEYGVKV